MTKFELIKLPYASDALEPVISAETIGFHYGKHLQTYVNNLNALLPGSGLEDLTLEEIVCKSEGGIYNNAGQILNHNMYFTQFREARADNAPTGSIAEAINSQFGSFDNFREEFQKKGATLFGSGWVWLSAAPIPQSEGQHPSGKETIGELVITQEPNAGNPLTKGLKPLLTFDVWEHAYYLDYQNRRPDHLAALWQLIDWDEINRRLG